MAISDNGDTKTYHNELGQAHEAMGVVVVNGDTMTYTNSLGQPKEALGVVILEGGSGGGEGGPVEWVDVLNKPATFPPIIGTTATTAKAGNYAPTWGEVTNKPAVIGAGATQQEALTAIGAIPISQKGQANGVAPLDSAGLVPLEHLNVSGLTFKGAWDPVTNTPVLLNGTGNTGDFYKASADGTFNFGNGDHTFIEGDWVMFAAGVWQRLGSKETVASVNGKMGVVNLTAADVGALPDTYLPDWDDIQGKPPQPRGTISAPIPALYCSKTADQSIPHSIQTAVSWPAAVYDEFGMKSGNNFIIPPWATHARITVALVYNPNGTGYRFARIQRNSSFVTSMRQAPASAGAQTEFVLHTPIMPVAGGDVFVAETWQNTGGDLSLLSNGSSWIQIELFTTN